LVIGSFVFEIVLFSKNCGLRLDLGADLVSLQKRAAVSLSGKGIPFSAKFLSNLASSSYSRFLSDGDVKAALAIERKIISVQNIGRKNGRLLPIGKTEFEQVMLCQLTNLARLYGGAEGARTPGLRIANAALCQTELLPHATKNTVSSFEFQASGLGLSTDCADYSDVKNVKST
jgi:hypothetical protein